MEQLVELAAWRAVTNSSRASPGEPAKAEGREMSRSSESSFGGGEEQAELHQENQETRSLRKSQTAGGRSPAGQVAAAGSISR